MKILEYISLFSSPRPVKTIPWGIVKKSTNLAEWRREKDFKGFDSGKLSSRCWSGMAKIWEKEMIRPNLSDIMLLARRNAPEEKSLWVFYSGKKSKKPCYGKKIGLLRNPAY